MLVTKATAQIQDNLLKLGLVHSSIWVLYVSLKYYLILKHLLPIFGVLMHIKNTFDAYIFLQSILTYVVHCFLLFILILLLFFLPINV